MNPSQRHYDPCSDCPRRYDLESGEEKVEVACSGCLYDEALDEIKRLKSSFFTVYYEIKKQKKLLRSR